MDYFTMPIFFLPGLSLSQRYWGVCLSLPPALTPGISTGAASLSCDNNPKYLPCRCQKSVWDYNIVQGDNPVYTVVKKWGEVCFRNLVDGWTEWEGTARGGGGSVGFHWGTKWLLLFLTGLCSHIKKGWEAQPIIGPTFWIFLSFIFPPLWLHPSEVLPSKKRHGLLATASTVRPLPLW